RLHAARRGHGGAARAPGPRRRACAAPLPRRQPREAGALPALPRAPVPRLDVAPVAPAAGPPAADPAAPLARPRAARLLPGRARAPGVLLPGQVPGHVAVP